MASNSIPNIEISRYNGTVLLNKRTFERASELFDPSREKTPKELSIDDVADALRFVEIVALSNGLVFDGTLPTGDKDDLNEWTETLRDNTGINKLIPDPVGDRDGTSHNEDVAHAALGLSSFLNDDGGEVREFTLTKADSDLVKRDGKTPDVEGHIKFKDELSAINDSLRRERAENIGSVANDLAANYRDNERFRGSKCLAAIALMGRATSQAALNAYDYNPDDQALRVTGGLINRFRLYYVRQLSRQSHSIYLPEASLEPLSKLDGQFASQSFLAAFSKQLGATPSLEFAGLSQGFSWEITPPPIGLHMLMETSATEPAQLLVEANAFLDRYRKKLLAHVWRSAHEIE